jgi:hypothetical protein
MLGGVGGGVTALFTRRLGQIVAQGFLLRPLGVAPAFRKSK